MQQGLRTGFFELRCHADFGFLVGPKSCSDSTIVSRLQICMTRGLCANSRYSNRHPSTKVWDCIHGNLTSQSQSLDMHGNARSMPRVVILSTHSYIGTSGLSTIRFGSYQFHFVPCLPEPLEKGMLEDMSAVINHVQEDLSSPDEPSCRQTAPRQEPPPYRMRRPGSFPQARAPGSALSGFYAYTVECRLATPPPHDGMGSRA